MKLLHEAHYLIYGFYFLIFFYTTAEEYRSCPLGFDLSYDEGRKEYICFKLKEPETFDDKYIDCEENIYSLELHFRHNVTRPSTGTFWIDYRSKYPGGPYVNLANTKLANISYDNNKDLCLIATNREILVAVRCDEMHNRYCFVKSLLRNIDSDSLLDLQSFNTSPLKMCLLTVTSTSNVTWTDAKSLCEYKEISQINTEWSYENTTREDNQGEAVTRVAKLNITPQKLIDQILHELKQLFESEEEIWIHQLDSVIDQVNHLLSLQLDLAVPGELPFLLHELGPKVDARGGGIAVRDNIGLNIMLDSGNAISFVKGYIVHRHTRFTTDSFEIIRYYFSFPPESFNSTYSDVVVSIPGALMERLYQHSYLVFWNDIFFHDPRGVYIINSRVISINHSTNTPPEDKIISIHLRPLITEERNMRRACVHWHFSVDGTGYWSEDGCIFIRPDDPELLDTCECNFRFTYYAEALTPMLTVEELIEQLLNDIHELLDSPMVSDVDHVFDQLDVLFKSKNVVFPNELLHLLQELIGRVIFQEITSTTVRSNVGLLVAKPTAFARGITVARSDDHIFTEDTFNIFTNPLDSSMLDINLNDAILNVDTIGAYMPQISYLVFQDGRVFNDSCGNYTIISRILSMNHSTPNEFENENYEVIFYIRPLIAERNITTRRTCVRWIFDNETGYWSEEGCELILSGDPNLLDACQCTWFLTYYAMALSPEPHTTDGTTTDISETTTTTEIAFTDTTLTTEVIITRPEEQIQEVLESLYQLLNQTTPILVDDISQVFNQVDELLNIKPGLDFPGQILQLLEELGMKVDLNGILTSAVVRDNIGLLMADVTVDNPVRGVVVASRDNDAFTMDAFDFLTGPLDSNILNVNVSEAVIYLPISVTKYPRRISFVVYHNARAFSYDRDVYTTNSRILSVSIGDYIQFERGEVIDIHLKPVITKPNRDERRVCAYWRFVEDGNGYWSQEGCKLIKSRDPWILDICRCNHLTHFAEVLFPRSVFSETNEHALVIISIIGCSLSIFGITVIILTAAFFRCWRKKFRNQIWLQLCIALFIMSICYLIVVFSEYDQYSISCILTGIVLHYSILASFCWMLVVAVKSYKDLVLVFIKQEPHKKLIAASFSWGTPIVVIGILLIADSQSYLGHFEEMNPSSNFCFPSGTAMWLAVYTPLAVMLLVNWTIFILIIRKIGFAPRGPHSHKAGDCQEAIACIRLSIVLAFLFGLPWLFGFFGYNIIVSYFFTCTVTTQGFVLFLLVICGNTQTKNLWLRKLKWRQQKSFTVTSSCL